MNSLNSRSTLSESHLSQDVLGQFVREWFQRFKRPYRLIELRLFGSRAKGLAKESSDYDLFIVLEENNPSLLASTKLQLYQALKAQFQAQFDLTLMNSLEFERALTGFQNVALDAISEGVEL